MWTAKFYYSFILFLQNFHSWIQNIDRKNACIQLEKEIEIVQEQRGA